MKVRKALIRTGITTLVVATFAVLLGLFQYYTYGPQMFGNFFLPKLIAVGIPILVITAIHSFLVGLKSK